MKIEKNKNADLVLGTKSNKNKSIKTFIDLLVFSYQIHKHLDTDKKSRFQFGDIAIGYVKEYKSVSLVEVKNGEMTRMCQSQLGKYFYFALQLQEILSELNKGINDNYFKDLSEISCEEFDKICNDFQIKEKYYRKYITIQNNLAESEIEKDKLLIPICFTQTDIGIMEGFVCVDVPNLINSFDSLEKTCEISLDLITTIDLELFEPNQFYFIENLLYENLSFKNKVVKSRIIKVNKNKKNFKYVLEALLESGDIIHSIMFGVNKSDNVLNISRCN